MKLWWQSRSIEKKHRQLREAKRNFNLLIWSGTRMWFIWPFQHPGSQTARNNPVKISRWTSIYKSQSRYFVDDAFLTPSSEAMNFDANYGSADSARPEKPCFQLSEVKCRKNEISIVTKNSRFSTHPNFSASSKTTTILITNYTDGARTLPNYRLDFFRFWTWDAAQLTSFSAPGRNGFLKHLLLMAANGRQAYHVTQPPTIPTWIFPASTFVWIFCSPPSLVQSGPLLFLGSKNPPSLPFHLVPNQLPQTLPPTRAHPASSADRDPEPVCKRKKRGRHQVSQVRQASGSNRTKTSFFRISGNF